MARMKTGRLTTKTTPPQKPSVSTKPGVSNVSNQGEWDKYGADYNANKNYGNEVKAYQEKKKKYDEEMKGASGGYDYLKFGGKSNTRRLNTTELAEFNKSQGTEQEWVDIPKSYKGKVSDVKAYMGKSKAPVAPTKREQPKVPELTGTMNILKPEPIKTKKTGIKTIKEAPAPEKFVNPGKSVKDVKVRYQAALVGNSGRRDYGKAGKGAGKGAGTLKAARVEKSSKKTYNTGYKREEKQFKAYAGDTATGDSFVGMAPGDIRNYRKEAKSTRAEYRKQPDSDTKSMGKAAMTSEIRQSRKAEKFSKKVYNLEGKGGVKHFSDKNYGGNIIKDYRASEDNANNRNNMTNKLKAIGDKTSKRLSELEKSTRGGFQYNQVNQ